MARRSFSLALIVLVAALFGAGRSASADSVQQRLARAELDRRAAEQVVKRLERRTDRLIAAYGNSQGALQQAAVDIVTAYRQQLVVSAQLAAAQTLLNRQAATAFEAGPGMSMELALGATSSGDLASIEIYAARTIGVSADAV